MGIRRLKSSEVEAFVRERSRSPFDEATLRAAAAIVGDIRQRGEPALRRYAKQYDGRPDDAPLICERSELLEALNRLPREDREMLERVAGRIRAFAEAQRASMRNLSTTADGFEVGHVLEPVRRAGCYAPGGRYPLPSSVLMTAIPARAAGVAVVLVASPRPEPITLAAAAVAGVEALVPVGGAPAIAALAYGAGPIAPVDVIAGPGNQWVTAAKHVVSRDVRIDMLAGPSELLIIADSSADPAVVAADLLAQAEHDPQARPMALVLDPGVADSLEIELARRLETLPTRGVAEQALVNHGFLAVVESVDEAIRLADGIAAEHVQIVAEQSELIAKRIAHAGALFIGCGAAEVFGDYGVGPNHTLPTGGGARGRSGLSVLDFLRVRAFIREHGSVPRSDAIVRDTAALARLERLEAHARAAEMRHSR